MRQTARSSERVARGYGPLAWLWSRLMLAVSARTVVIVLLTAFTLSLLLQLSGESLLPPKYFADGQGIASLVQQDTAFHVSLSGLLDGGGSFTNVVWLYRHLGFGLISLPAVGVVTWLLGATAAAITAAVGRKRWTVLGLTVTSAWIALLAVYLGQYSKELPALGAVWIATFLLRLRRWGTLLAAVILCAYAIAFRPYWLLVVAMWIFFGWLLRRQARPRFAALVIVLVITLVSQAYHVVHGGYLSGIRDALNASRSGSPDAITAIYNAIPSGSLPADLIDAFTGWLRIVFPVELLAHGGLVRIGGFTVQAMTTLLMLLVGWGVRAAAGFGTVRSAAGLARGLLALWLAFTFVQGIFEPDFGSAMKHAVAMLPVVVALGARLGVLHKEVTREARASVLAKLSSRAEEPLRYLWHHAAIKGGRGSRNLSVDLVSSRWVM